uniref:Leucine rich repeat containing 46 n=1 Tax=Buteo japonicus TaxID=224669 RepID=A0A8C0B8J0_9AVES
FFFQNQIEKIENLGCFPNLRFLSLAGNRIRRVENLQTLRHLRVLDLSHNQIQTLDPDELPRSLRLLDLRGNECTHQDGYRELVVGALPHLLQLDAQHVRGSVREEKEEGGSSSSEDEDDESPSEPSGPFTAGKGAQTEAGHVACLGVKQAGPSVPKGERSGRELWWPCQVSCNSPPSLRLWQISLRICTGSWPGARGGGGGRPWRNTGPVWKSCRSVGVCCCRLHS